MINKLDISLIHLIKKKAQIYEEMVRNYQWDKKKLLNHEINLHISMQINLKTCIKWKNLMR